MNGSRGMLIDDFTSDTVNAMVRYIASDEKIARYTGAPIEYVRRRRAECPKRVRGTGALNYAPAPHQQNENLDLAADHFNAMTRKADAAFVEALKRAGHQR